MNKNMADETNKDVKGSYAFVNGLNMYYETSGSGSPLILLHGGVGASEMFGSVQTQLAEKRQVIAVHLHAHGRTADIDRPLSFELMADDIAALIRHLGIERVDIMGWYPEVLGCMAQMTPEAAETMKQTPLYLLYPNADWAVLFTKLCDLLKKDYDWSKDVATIKSPMMIVFADADAVRTAHVMEFFAMLGGGQRDASLAVL